MCKPAKDKAIGRFMVKNMVDSGAMNDLRASSVFEGYQLPKLYSKYYYCVSCAVHSRIVRVRNVEKRKIRDPPVRFRRTEDKPAGGAAGGAPKPKV
jgi:small subunit ribosomal protein S26e